MAHASQQNVSVAGKDNKSIELTQLSRRLSCVRRFKVVGCLTASQRICDRSFHQAIKRPTVACGADVEEAPGKSELGSVK